MINPSIKRLDFNKDNAMGKLHEIYQAEDFDLKTLLKSLDENKSEDINQADEKGYTLLHLACIFKDIDTITELLQRKAKVTVCDNYQNTPLQYALYTGHEKIIRLLVKNGADVNAKLTLGNTALYDFCRACDFFIVKLLLDLGADISFAGTHYDTLLNTALALEKPEKNELIQILFNHGGIGINNDFTLIPKTTLDSTLIDNTFIVASTRDGNPFTSDNSITNVDQFKKAIAAGVQFNYKILYKMIKNVVEDGNENPELLLILEELKKGWQRQESMKSFKEHYIFYFASHLSFFQEQIAKTKIPVELIESIENLADELEIHKKPKLSKK